ncbi:hypothetical protein [Desulforegula conservatrix]|uniref:hypothetical protein n=1 Tax=Desulforegula conservatrix TaxID=153026 RepID=UPI000423CA6C|nr:hypothetical protein [Desulforegula conservatrix]
MKKIVIIIGCLFVLNGCAALVKRIINPDPPLTELKFEDITIKTDNGDNFFKNIVVKSSGYNIVITCNLSSNSKYDCVNTYDFQLVDQDNTTQRKVISVNKGESKPISLSCSRSDFDGEIKDIKIILKQSKKISETEANKNTPVSDENTPVNYKFSLHKPSYNKDKYFSDSNISIRFDIEQSGISFNITNKSGGRIKLDWDSFSFVDVNGAAHRVIHSGVRIIDKEKPQAIAIIPPSAQISDSIYLSDYIESSKIWENKPLFPTDKGLAVVLVKGKTFSIFMPLEINGVVKNYNFVFRIDDV